ncbi:MAG: exodeoxyribonuclease VII small subunit [Deltaproteobacteria bacterium]|nr:exodeoxyribonuclease VII small subunit [Deltaproteobacteria bacterium]
MTRKGKDQEEGAEQFDRDLDQLRSIVEKLEQGDLSLHESLELFEKGIALGRNLLEILNRAEGRVEELLATMERVPFGDTDE